MSGYSVTQLVLAYQAASVRFEIIIYAQPGLGTSGGKFQTEDSAAVNTK